ncbi:hypothetical protein VTO73DRAFT_13755 [Trametes versicolor]
MSTADTQPTDPASAALHATQGAPLELDNEDADTPGEVQVVYSKSSPRSITPETVLQLLLKPALPLPGHYDHPQLVHRITEDFVVVRGMFHNPVEATMMEFVRTHTKIPIPTMHLVFTRVGTTTPTRVTTFITSVLAQIQGYIQELRSIPADVNTPPGPIGGGICEGRWSSENGAGPFPTHEALVEWWNRFFYLPGERGYNGVDDRFHADQPLVFSHGDLNLRNIIVHEGVVWLVDWQHAGWYPWYVDPTQIATDWGTMEFPTPEDWAPSVLPFFPDSSRELRMFNSIAYRLNVYYLDARFAVRHYDTATPAACEKV